MPRSNSSRSKRDEIHENITPLTPRTTHRLGNILLRNKAVKQDDLLRAVGRQLGEHTRLGDILRTDGALRAGDLLRAVSEQAHLRPVNLEIERPDPRLLAQFDPADCLRLGFIPWRSQRGVWILAIADPSQKEAVANLVPKEREIRFVTARLDEIHHFIGNFARNELSNRANRVCPTQFSSKHWTGQKPALIGALLLCCLMICTTIWLYGAFIALMGWIFLALIGNTLFRLTCLGSYLFLRQSPPQVSLPPKDLPRVSILIPLLKEHDILDRLIRRMSKLDYPRPLLQICLVYEENDAATKLHLATRRLPAWFTKIEVPEDSLQTKPRAMNYALDFCSGDIIGVFDAEDAPETDQIHKVVNHFDQAPQDVVALQCILDFYNAKTNWLSRCFTVEYAILFRVILKGLDALKLPIPLGGTSVYFKRQILEDLGRWDAYNVTEDAELGIRLRRFGYRTEIVHSVTYEEANFRLPYWVKQRSRWLKGFLLTWITHIRHPIALYRDLGLRGFLLFNILFLGTFTAFASAPFALPMWLLTFQVDLPLYSDIPRPFLWALIVTFILTEAMLFALGFTATRTARLRHLTKILPTMLVYWPIGSLAAYKALYEIFVHPNYWDKTQHGINDKDCEDEISKLTQSGTALDAWA